MKLVFRLEKGFALPSIVLASITMLAVLLSAIQATSSVTRQLQDQYYIKLAQTAAESGASYAVACMRANNYTAPWVAAGKNLSPETDCNGNVTAGGTYVVVNGNTRTTFSVISLTIANSYAHINVTGTTELMRRTGGGVWRSYNQSIVRDISITDLLATSSSSGRYEVCGIIGGNVWCWGRNGLGQLGNGTQTDSETPIKVIRKEGVLLGNTDTDVAVGDGNVCAVSSGEVYCWGSKSMVN